MILLLLLLLLLYSDRMGRVWPKTKAISMLDLQNNQTLHILKKKKKENRLSNMTYSANRIVNQPAL